MQNDAGPQPPGYAHGPVTKPPDWHALVAWDVFFNNLTTGLFLVAALTELPAPALFTDVARVAYPVALILLLVDLVLLVIDLGDPLRFHHMLRVFKPTSPMSLGVWCLSAYAFALTVTVLLGLLAGARLEWLRRGVVMCTLPPALGALVYKGVLFSTSAQPIWKDARWLGAYLTSAALLLGGAILLALAILTGPEPAVALLHRAVVWLLVLNLVPLALLLASVRTALRGRSRAAALGLALATPLPLCLLLVTTGTIMQLAAIVSIVLGSLALRFVIVQLPHAREAKSH